MKSEAFLANRSGRVRAFSLQEMMVVLVLTVLVMALAFSVLQLVQKQMHGISVNLDHNTKVNLLRQALWNDFHNSETIQLLPQEQSLLFDNGLQSVRYVFEDQLIIRDRDTLISSVYQSAFLWEGKAVQQGAVDAISIEFGPTETGPKIFAFKRHTAADNLRQVWDSN